MAGVVLAVDAGGTWVRMGLFRCEEGLLDALQFSRSASVGWARFEADLRGFLTRPQVRAALETARERAAVFALAGPTDAGKGSVTRWGPALFREVATFLDPLPFDHCILLNDMEAANHAVVGASKATATGAYINGWTKDSPMTCSDCHGTVTGGDGQGPHGSANPYMLKGIYTANVAYSGETESFSSDIKLFGLDLQNAGASTGKGKYYTFAVASSSTTFISTATPTKGGH